MIYEGTVDFVMIMVKHDDDPSMDLDFIRKMKIRSISPRGA